VSLYDRIDFCVALGGVECTNECRHFVFFSLAIGFYGQPGSQRPRPDFHAFERLLGFSAQHVVFLAFDDFPLEKPIRHRADKRYGDTTDQDLFHGYSRERLGGEGSVRIASFSIRGNKSVAPEPGQAPSNVNANA